MAKHVFDAPKLQTRYDLTLKRGDMGKLDRELIMEEAEQALESDGTAVEVNRDIEQHADVMFAPSLHALIHDIYSITDSELRRLKRASVATGLDNHQSKHLLNVTTVLTRTANLDMGLREQSQLEMKSDDEILALTKKALEQQGKLGPEEKKEP